jgi:hypothetical protein
MSGRHQRFLNALHSPGLPMEDPLPSLDFAEVRAWRDIVAAAPAVFRCGDEIYLSIVAMEFAWWRQVREQFGVREMYRKLGIYFIPMRERRRLLFPNRTRKR